MRQAKPIFLLSGCYPLYERVGSTNGIGMGPLITVGPKVGMCNICGESGPLTEDHTPPKGAARATQVEMRHIGDLLSAKKSEGKRCVSQNGVKFRTLCGRCNNSLLGANYDIAFNDFCQKTASYLKSSLALPRKLYIKGKPQKIMRSLIGHLCAMGINRYGKNLHYENLKSYLLNQDELLPSYLDIYYWVYPYGTRVLVRDAAIKDFRVPDPASIWLMKFFPIAFLVIWDKPRGYQYPQLPNMARWGHLGADDEMELPVHLDIVPDESWPELPNDERMIIFGEWAIGVSEKAKRKSKLLIPY